MTKPHPRGMTIDEVAAEFGYHRATLERAIIKRKLKADKTTKPYRITRNEVQSWIERNTR